MAGETTTTDGTDGRAKSARRPTTERLQGPVSVAGRPAWRPIADRVQRAW